VTPPEMVSRRHVLQSLLAIGGLPLVACAPTTPARPASSRVLAPTVRDVSYGAHRTQTMDVYLPAPVDPDSTPVVFYVHGGGWFAGDKEEAANWASFLSEAGCAFVSINYRLTHTSESFILSHQIDDIGAAITFALRQARDWRVSTTKTAIMGASAGAHLALLYTYAFDARRAVNAAISFCGALDLTEPRLRVADVGADTGMSGVTIGTLVSWLLGQDYARDPAKWRDASPITHISRSVVPTFLLHGKADELIPYEQSVRAWKLLTSHGVPSELELLDDVKHDLLPLDLTPSLRKVHRFLRTYI
jgi:acetyl esterase/lipase